MSSPNRSKIKRTAFFLSFILGILISTTPPSTSLPFTIAYVFSVLCFVNDEFSREEAGITLLLYGVGMVVTHIINLFIH